LRKLSYLETRSKTFILLLGFILTALLGIADYATGYEFSFAVFYLIPVSLLAWTVGRRWGIVASIASATIWMVANYLASETSSNPLVLYWNTATGFGSFYVVAVLLAKVREILEQERELARTDRLTGAANSRSFYELAATELYRARRYDRPFTVAYIDLDGFKSMNDQFGHSTGDHLLRTVVAVLQANLRVTDIVARLGGDEFVILLPETGYEPAQKVMPKLQAKLSEEMRKHHWPVTFSIGVLTCNCPPGTVDEMLNIADKLMYEVKNTSRNAIRYKVCPPDV